MPKLNLSEKFWSLSASQALAELQTSEAGLSQKEVDARLDQYGPNEIERHQPLSKTRILLRQLKSPLIFILLIAGAISAFLLDFRDAVFILLAAGVNAGLGFYQENKAERALEHLKSYITQRIRVTRNGHEKEINANQLVPGDIIYVSRGSRIPADARIIYSSDLQINEALLTGESLPEDKTPEPSGPDNELADRTSMIFSGTLIAQGFGRAVVTATGGQTEIGHIASLVSKQRTIQTPLQKILQKFALQASGVILLLTAGIFFIATSSGVEILEAFLISVAVLVSAIPEGLPIVMTVILAIGVQRLAKKNGVVRRLSAAETLGSTSLILTDKTGTLTQAKMKLARVRLFEHPNYADTTSAEKFLLSSSLLNVESVIENPDEGPEKWNVLGRPLETALVKGAVASGIFYPDIKAGKDPLMLLPFNSLHKFSVSVHQLSHSQNWTQSHFKAKDPYVLSMLGAPEVLLKYSNLSAKRKEEILAEVKAMANGGDRLVAVGVKEIHDVKNLDVKNEKNYQGIRFLGTISFRDPLRPGVIDSINEVRRAGIRIIIVTGDHEGTAISVANQLNIKIDPKNVIHGSELESMNNDELKARLNDLKLVARVSPAGKLKIVRAFQETGETVAMNGDGINDAPALKEANIGIAMGSGTDVSKDVADLVLLDDDFKTIVEAVKEGRRILRNIRKAIVYLTSDVLDEVILLGGSLILGLALPFNALQILWVNFFTDSFPGIALAFEDKIDPQENHPLQIKHGIFTSEMKFMIFVSGIASSTLLFGSYWYLLRLGYNPEIVRTFIFATFGTYTLFLGFSMRSLKRSIFQYNPFSNKYMVASVLFGLFLMAIAIYVPFFQGLFKTVNLSTWWIFASLVFSIFNILVIELSKLAFHGRID